MVNLEVKKIFEIKTRKVGLPYTLVSNMLNNYQISLPTPIVASSLYNATRGTRLLLCVQVDEDSNTAVISNGDMQCSIPYDFVKSCNSASIEDWNEAVTTCAFPESYLLKRVAKEETLMKGISDWQVVQEVIKLGETDRTKLFGTSDVSQIFVEYTPGQIRHILQKYGEDNKPLKFGDVIIFGGSEFVVTAAGKTRIGGFWKSNGKVAFIHEDNFGKIQRTNKVMTFTEREV